MSIGTIVIDTRGQHSVEPLESSVSEALLGDLLPLLPQANLHQPDIPSSATEECGCQCTAYDVIVIRDHHLESEPLTLINAAHASLRTDGALVILLARNSLPRDIADADRRASYLHAMACRCGFVAVDPATIDPAFPCIRLKKSAQAPRWRLDLATRADPCQLSELFEKVFATTFDASLWQWKYGGDRGNGVIACRGQQLIAHYGCLYRRALCFGKPVTALQMCDVMVDPRERGVMTKQGAFFQVAATLLEYDLGLRRLGLPFGFPNARAARIGERQMLYARVGRILELRWQSSPDRPALSTRAIDITQRTQDYAPVIDRLWTAMRRDLADAILVMRDSHYLRQRYSEHPLYQYRIFLVSSRLMGRPLGLIVLRVLDDSAELMDMVGALAHIPILIEHARRLTDRWGRNALHCWISHQHAHRLATTDVSVVDPDVVIPTNIWVDGPSADSLHDKWWLMSGDTDFR